MSDATNWWRVTWGPDFTVLELDPGIHQLWQNTLSIKYGVFLQDDILIVDSTFIRWLFHLAVFDWICVAVAYGMMTSATFSASLALCGGIHPSPVVVTQRPVMWSFDVIIDLRLTHAWANSQNGGDWRLHRAHYGVKVMVCSLWFISNDGPFNCELVMSKRQIHSLVS